MNLLKWTHLFLPVVLVTVILTVPYAYAGGKDYVEADGYATIVQGRKDLARELSINSACRRAVEQAVGVMVESKTLITNFELLNDSIYARSAGFIKSYSIISEHAEPDAYRTRLRALVLRSKLESGLTKLGVLKKQTRIMVFMSEQDADQSTPSFWWGGDGGDGSGIVANALVAKFMQKDFRFVERQVALAADTDDAKPAGLGPSLSNNSALRLASAGGAEVVIIGQAQARQAATAITGTNIRSCQATVSARAVYADSGEILASCSSNAVVAHMNPSVGGAEALKKASEECAEKLIGPITSRLKQKANGHHTVRLIVRGLNFEDLAELKEMVNEQIGPVDQMYDRGYKDDTAILDLELSSNAREIAPELNNILIKNGSLKITSVSENKIQLKFTSK